MRSRRRPPLRRCLLRGGGQGCAAARVRPIASGAAVGARQRQQTRCSSARARRTAEPAREHRLGALPPQQLVAVLCQLTIEPVVQESVV